MNFILLMAYILLSFQLILPGYAEAKSKTKKKKVQKDYALNVKGVKVRLRVQLGSRPLEAIVVGCRAKKIKYKIYKNKKWIATAHMKKQSKTLSIMLKAKEKTKITYGFLLENEQFQVLNENLKEYNPKLRG